MEVTMHEILEAELVTMTGTSKKTGKPYKMTALRIPTPYGEVELILDTKKDRAGIILDMMTASGRKE